MSSTFLTSDLPAELFTTNRAPNNEELALARTLMRNLESQLSSLATGETNSDSRASNAEISISESLAALRNVVSPIRRVPTDVIREVFSACIDEDYNAFDPRCVSFSRISSGLRQIALSTPALWTIIIVGIQPNNSEACLRRKKYWVEELIHRSGNLPLDISLYDRTSLHKENYDEILNLLCSCHLRWREATFTSDYTLTPIFSLLASLSTNDFPILEKINFSTKGDVTRTPKYLAVFASPSLKKVLNVEFDNIIDHRSYLPLATITHLDCSAGEWRPSLFIDFADVLRQCQSLISLTFVAGNELESIKRAIDLPCLQDLSVVEYQATLCIFMAINAPRLQSLRLELELGGIYSDKIAAFLERSPDVQTLQLRLNEDMDTRCLQEILRSCPQLVTLVCLYTRCYYSNWEGILLDFVDGNTCSSNILCPNLQYLEVDIGHVGKWYAGKFDTLKKLIMGKLEPSSSLAVWKRLTINFRYYRGQKKTADRLYELRDSNRILIEGFGMPRPFICSRSRTGDPGDSWFLPLQHPYFKHST